MSQRILIVDDERTTRINLAAYLEDEGMAVMAVASGEEAVELVRRGSLFDVCIMDMRLPGMDGNDAVRALHALAPAVRFVVHTASRTYAPPPDLGRIGITAACVFLKPLLDLAPLAETAGRLATPSKGGAYA